jgi:hypothetical protein
MSVSRSIMGLIDTMEMVDDEFGATGGNGEMVRDDVRYARVSQVAPTR